MIFAGLTITRKTNADADVQLGKNLAQITRDYVANAIEQATTPLRDRLCVLEDRPVIQYRGIWQNARYAEGSLVTLSGGMWVAMRETSVRPGEDDSGWRLVVKSGRAV